VSLRRLYNRDGITCGWLVTSSHDELQLKYYVFTAKEFEEAARLYRTLDSQEVDAQGG